MPLTPLPPPPSPRNCASGAYFLPYWPKLVPYLLRLNFGRTLGSGSGNAAGKGGGSGIGRSSGKASGTGVG